MKSLPRYYTIAYKNSTIFKIKIRTCDICGARLKGEQSFREHMELHDENRNTSIVEYFENLFLITFRHLLLNIWFLLEIFENPF